MCWSPVGNRHKRNRQTNICWCKTGWNKQKRLTPPITQICILSRSQYAADLLATAGHPLCGQMSTLADASFIITAALWKGFKSARHRKKKKKKIQSYQDSFHPRLRVVRLSHFSDETHVRFRLRRLSAEPAEVLPGFFCLAPAFSSACTTFPLNVVRCVSRNSRKISRFFYCHI